MPESLPVADAGQSPSWLVRMYGRVFDVIRQNLVPGLILQVFVLLFIGGYYVLTPVHVFFSWVAQIKEAGGVLYAGVSTAVFAGLIPFLIQKSRPQFRDQIPTGHLWFFLVFWFVMGLVFDVMMQTQAWVFGSDSNLKTLLSKTVADMLLFTPLIGLPMISISLLWRQNGFSFTRTGQFIGRKRWWSEQFMSMLIANWTVWPVAIAAVYSLPLPLQIPVQNLIMCFWCVLLIFMTDQNRQPE
jgi:hypothetical protein